MTEVFLQHPKNTSRDVLHFGSVKGKPVASLSWRVLPTRHEPRIRHPQELINGKGEKKVELNRKVRIINPNIFDTTPMYVYIYILLVKIYDHTPIVHISTRKIRFHYVRKKSTPMYWLVPRDPGCGFLVSTRMTSYIFRCRDPNLNLHLPRLHPGRGDNQTHIWWYHSSEESI